METTNATNRLTDLLSQIPEKIQNMYLMQIMPGSKCIAIQHPFWIFLDEEKIREIKIEEFIITIKSRHIAIILYKDKVDAQVIEF